MIYETSHQPSRCCIFSEMKNLFTGLAGKDNLGNAVLGGASDYIADIGAHLAKMFGVSDEEKVSMHVCFTYTCVTRFWEINQQSYCHI